MKSPFDLSGKTILVTGASSGIGRATCQMISEMGGKVIATGRNQERLEETVAALVGDGHTCFAGDLTKTEVIEGLVKGLERPIEGVVHSAGISNVVPIKFFSEKLIHDIIAINFIAPMVLTAQLLKRQKLAPGGSLVYLGSLGAHVGTKGNGLYAGSKAAMEASVRVLASEVAPKKIRANVLAPGMVNTPMNFSEGSPLTPEQLESDRKAYPLGYGEPEEVAAAAIYFLSDASRWVTGTTFIMDGGLTLT